MDTFADELLERARSAEGLADKIAAFAQIGKWIAIKNRLSDGEDREGSLLENLRRKVNGGGSGSLGGSLNRGLAELRS
jgi:hypothetical protein